MIATQQTSFLFVNKSQKSLTLSRSHGGTASAINRHAQLSRLCKLKKDSRRKEVPSPSNVTKRIVEQGWIRRECSKSDEDRKHGTGDDRSDGSYVESAESPLTSITSTTSMSELVPTVPIDSNSFDPFHCSAIEMNRGVREILQYYLSYSLISTFRTDALAKLHVSRYHRYYPVMEDDFKNALSNEMHIFAMLSATAARMTHITSHRTEYEAKTNFFMQQAVHSMRKYFLISNEGIPDRRILLDMTLLCIGEWYRGNYDATTIHLRAIKEFMRSLDIKRSPDRLLFEMIGFFDTFISIETATKPVYLRTWLPPPLTKGRLKKLEQQLDALLTQSRKEPLWNPRKALTSEDLIIEASGPFSLVFKQPSGTEALYLGVQVAGAEQRPGRGFTEAIAAGIFSEPMVRVLSDYVQWTDMAAYVFLDGDAPDADVEWVGKMAVAIVHELLSLSRLDQKEPMSLNECREECCRLSLIIILSHIISPMAWRSGRLNLIRLQRVLALFENRARETPDMFCRTMLQKQLTMWVLITGLFAAGTSPEAEWWIAKAADIAVQLELRSYIQLHRLAGRFLHFDTPQHASLSSLAVRVAETRCE